MNSLHSTYNPVREAERYIASLGITKKYKYFFLIECGLCYVIPPLRAINPEAKIISLHVSKDAAGGCGKDIPPENKADAEWYAGGGVDLFDFLMLNVEDAGADEIKMIEWRPALKLYPGRCRDIIYEALSFIKIADGSRRAEKFFSKAWERNAGKNIKIIKRAARLAPPLTPLDKSVIVAGASPSLENDIDIIKRTIEREGAALLSLSSAFAALNEQGITPDIVITTDGGFWAKLHLYALVRAKSGRKPLIVSTLNAALPSAMSDFPCVLLSDGSTAQNALLKNANLPCYVLPSRGTVSAAALDLALYLTSGAVFTAGIDFSGAGIRFHCRPYMLDVFLREGENRFAPFYDIQYKKSRLLDEGGSYKIYKEWFEKQKSYKERVRPLRDLWI